MSGTGVAVAGVVLAAGAGRRMGRPKATLEVDGEPLVTRAVRTLKDGGCDPVAVVVGAAGSEVRAVLETDVPAAVLLDNPSWAEGMAGSVRVALRWVGATKAAALVLLPVDTPGITPAVVDRLRRRFAAGGPALVAAYHGQPRNPVLIPADVWADVTASVQHDAGARRWLRAHPDRVAHVDCTDLGDPTDLDSPEDLRRWTDRPGAPARSLTAPEPGEQHGT